MKTLLLDANNLAMRSVHAMSRSGLTADGVATGPLLVFINSLSRHVKEERPDRLVACWDSGQSEYRLSLDPNYKANRNKPDPSFDEFKRTSFWLIKQFCSLAGIHQTERKGYEADDLIAKYVKETLGEIVILSSDKDFLQLLTPRVQQIRFSSAEVATERWTMERVQQEYGGHGHDYMLMLAMAGDASDNVPGLRRVGMPTARKLLVKHEGWKPFLDTLSDEDRERVETNVGLVSLLEPLPDLLLPPVPQWAPVGPGDAMYKPLLEFLIRYKLESVKTRLYDGTLWAEPQQMLDLTGR